MIKYGNGQDLSVHDLVFASSGPGSLEFLKQLPGTDAQQAALQRIQFVDARLMLHSDPVYAPADSKNWSFFNAEVQNGHCDASIWLAQVLAIPPPDTEDSLHTFQGQGNVWFAGGYLKPYDSQETALVWLSRSPGNAGGVDPRPRASKRSQLVFDN